VLIVLLSFLRPKEVLEARAANEAGELSAAQLREVEDKAIAEHVQKLLDSGVLSITDGEVSPPPPICTSAILTTLQFRREYFHLDFLKEIGGVTISQNSEQSISTLAAGTQLYCQA
jgi:5-methyltetrahydropteroyltriglutamate--homocysteine methyltransferase